MVILVDDEERENEGDLMIAAEKVTPETINFMAKYGRGLICVPMEEEIAEKLGLHLMSENSEDPFRTAWAVSVDASIGVTTGISAGDRARTIKLLANKNTTEKEFVRPGHVFPYVQKKAEFWLDPDILKQVWI